MGPIPKGTHHRVCVSPCFDIRGRSAFCICVARVRFIQKGAYPMLDAVHAVASRMDTVSIVNGDVWEHFRDVLARKVIFCRYITTLR
jgi:hypothetical protein